MKVSLLLFTALILSFLSNGQKAKDERNVKEVVNSFYNNFKHDHFGDFSKYTTKDINYVHPQGGWLKGREEVQTVLQEVHSSFLQKTPIKIDTMAIRFITPNVAIVNLIDTMGPYSPADSLGRGKNPIVKCIRTMVVIRKKGTWLLTQNHSTIIQ
jgi:uncharacterized protein (TIGR02246 family)